MVMARTKCPKCGKPIETTGETLPSHFPFCSPQCQNVDLYQWMNESYSVPVQTNRVVQQAMEDASTRVGEQLLGNEPESLN